MTTPIYDPNIPPGPSTSIGDAQPTFLTNFMALNNAFSANHIPLNALTDLGNHTIIQLLEQDSNFQTNAGEISIYSKLIGDEKESTNTAQVFFRYQGNAQEFSFTSYQIYSLGKGTAYFTFLPGGLIVYFGLVNVTLNPQASLKLLPAICRNIMSVNLCSVGTVSNYSPWISLQEPDNNGIYTTINLIDTLGSVGGRKPPTQLYYIVIGNI